PMEPILQPYPRIVSPTELREAPARCYLVEIRLADHIKDNPLPQVPGKASGLRSCTTRRASLRRFGHNLGIFRLEASLAPWLLVPIIRPLYLSISEPSASCSTLYATLRFFLLPVDNNPEFARIKPS